MTNLTPAHWQVDLQQHGACFASSVWRSKQKGSAYDAWRACPRGDWALWLCAELGVGLEYIIPASTACLREAWETFFSDELVPSEISKVLENWHSVTDKELRVATVRMESLASYTDNSVARTIMDSAACLCATSKANNQHPGHDEAIYDSLTNLALTEICAATGYTQSFVHSLKFQELTKAEAKKFQATYYKIHARYARIVRQYIPWSAVRDVYKVQHLVR